MYVSTRLHFNRKKAKRQTTKKKKKKKKKNEMPKYHKLFSLQITLHPHSTVNETLESWFNHPAASS